MSPKQKYGSTALIAGASEGIGSAFAQYLAADGMNLVLVARRPEPLKQLADELSSRYQIKVQCIPCDLSLPNANAVIIQALNGQTIDLLVYNAALSYIGPFEKNAPDNNHSLAYTNMITPMDMVYQLGSSMLERGRGGIILMASLAGFQGSGFLAAYAASKAFNRVFAESLWYEWKDRGVDVIGCCAGATSTPNFVNSKPEKTSAFAPRVQRPEEVAQECFKHLGRRPSFITGRGNKFASFIMQKLMPRKMAIKIMGDTTRKMYRF